MRPTFVFAIVITAFVQCKTACAQTTDQVNSERLGIVWDKNDTYSPYGHIKPPVLSLDSSAIYEVLANLLRFTNKLERDGATAFYDVHFRIDKEGKVLIVRRSTTPSLDKDMLQVEDALMYSIGVVEVPSLVDDPKTKVDYPMQVSFSIDDDEIRFRLLGGYNTPFLKKNFKRPL